MSNQLEDPAKAANFPHLCTVCGGDGECSTFLLLGQGFWGENSCHLCHLPLFWGYLVRHNKQHPLLIPTQDQKK